MKTNTAYNSLTEAVTVGLACIEQGLDRKEDVRESILGYVDEHYVNINGIGSQDDLPVSLLEMLGRVFGMSFEINDGRIGRLCRKAPAVSGIAKMEGGY